MPLIVPARAGKSPSGKPGLDRAKLRSHLELLEIRQTALKQLPLAFGKL